MCLPWEFAKPGMEVDCPPGAALGGEAYSWSEGAANSGGGPRLLQSGFSPPGGAQRGLGPEGAHLGGGHGRCSGSQARLQSWPHGADSPAGLSCGPGSLPRHPRVSRGPLGPSWGRGVLHLGGGLAHAGTEGSWGQAQPEEGRSRAGVEEVFGPSGVSTAAKNGGSPCRLRQTSACPMGSGWVGSGALREHRGGGKGPLAAPQRPRSQRPAAGQSQGSWEPRGHGRPAPHPQQEAGLGRAGFAHDADGHSCSDPLPSGVRYRRGPQEAPSEAGRPPCCLSVGQPRPDPSRPAGPSPRRCAQAPGSSGRPSLLC